MIKKRDGRLVPFEKNKIVKVFSHFDWSEKERGVMVDYVTKQVEKEPYPTHVEMIQNIVQQSLRDLGYEKEADIFEQVSEKRMNERLKRGLLHAKIQHITEKTGRENANVGNSPSAKLLQISEEASKEFATVHLISEEAKEAVAKNWMYIHDFSWMPVGTQTCCFIPFAKLLKRGFNPGHGMIRPPKRIRTATQLVCIIFQSNQSEQHGGQASGWFDEELAPYVELEYDYQVKDIRKMVMELGSKMSSDEIERLAWARTEKEVEQAMEALVFNLNTMHSRSGSQTPFTSVNVGTDMSRGGRLVVEKLLWAYEKGLGNGEQALFPNIVFKVKKGINFEPGTPNHDLLCRSLEVSATRLFPTYNFQDCQLNAPFKEDIPSMGCRTRVASNVIGYEINERVTGRGNLSFTTLNLPGIALDVKHGVFPRHEQVTFDELAIEHSVRLLPEHQRNAMIGQYFVALNHVFEIGRDQLIARLKYQSGFKPTDFPFLMRGVWKDSEHLDMNAPIETVLKHGSLAIGFIGLSEALVALIGKHHGEDYAAQRLGVEIIRFLYKLTRKATKQMGLNFGLLATPAEGLTGKLVNRDRSKHGIVEKVTDKEWYTNSMHVDVRHEISMFEKIKIEGEYQVYCNGGTITYVECKENLKYNPSALYSLLQWMEKQDIALGAFNFPIDHCRDCGEHGYIEDACHVCGSENIQRIRRITGYLADIERFNHAKKCEANARVKHEA